MRYVFLCVVALLSGSADWAHTQNMLTVELGSTLPFNVPLPLIINQTGETEINFVARYASEPFVPPICWIWRVGYWKEEAGWELQAIHHKLLLENKPGEVEEFSISHGFNSISVVRGWNVGGAILRAGAGVVLAHPENSVRGLRLPEDGGILNSGYYMSGATVTLGVGYRVVLTELLYLSLDGMLHGSKATVPVVNGTADVSNIAATVGVGVGFSIAWD